MDLDKATLVHATDDELWIRRPFDVLDGIQTGEEASYYQGLNIADHQTVLDGIC